jgi:predicted ferric reductase
VTQLIGRNTNSPAASIEWTAPWYARRWWGVVLCLGYPAAAVTPLALLALLGPASDHSRIAEAGVDAAVIGFTLLALQFIVAARLRWVEAPFGLDVLMRFHRTMALVAVGLLCAHPLLVAGGGGGWGLLTHWRVPWYLWAGRLGLAVLLLHVAGAVLRPRLPMGYDAWRRWHNVGALTLLGLGFAHSLAIGDDLSTTAGQIVWVVLATVAVGAWLYGKVVRPALLRRCRGFRVTAVQSEGPRVWTLELEPTGGHRFTHAPGQFQFLRLHSPRVSGEEHPFTIASSPAVGRGAIRLTIKESGDFTRTLRHARPGDAATVHGPLGRFSYVLHPDERELVLVAGGVGITPHISMLRHMSEVREARRRVLLVYASRTEADILFREELCALEGRGGCPALRVVHLLSKPPDGWEGESGHLDAGRLLQMAGGAEAAVREDKAFYLCCPPAMTAALIRGLRRHGVSAARIHTDYFSI